MSDIKAGFVWSDKAENFANNKAMALRLNRTIGEATVNLNEVLPNQAGQSGKFLKTDGTNVLWDAASSVGWINVKDYGAVGDGVTDDTSAINLAIAALTNNSVLYFPPGQYNTQGQHSVSGLSNVVILGMQSVIYLTVQANNLIEISNTCSNFQIKDLVFAGSATSRLNGVHCRFNAQSSIIENCEFYGASDFGLFVGGTNLTENVRIENCWSHDNQGDSYHTGRVNKVLFKDCVASDSGDDSFGIIGYESSSHPALYVTIDNCTVYDSGFRGFAIEGVEHFSMSDCNVYGAVGAGIEVGHYGGGAMGANYNEDIDIRNCSMTDCISALGPYAAFNLYFCKRVRLQNCGVTDALTGSAVAVYDFDDVQIRDLNVLFTRAGFARGVITPDATSLSGRAAATTWGNLFISDYSFDMQQSTNNEAIYISPHSTITIGSLLISNSSGSQASSSSNYIFYNRVSSPSKIGNNVCLQSKSIGHGGSGPAATLFNNN